MKNFRLHVFAIILISMSFSLKFLILFKIVDMQCYTSSAAHGEDHKECATGCIKGGAPVGLLDKDGKVFLLVKNEKDAGDYSRLVDYASQTVTITGTLYNRGGINSVVVGTVQAAK